MGNKMKIAIFFDEDSSTILGLEEWKLQQFPEHAIQRRLKR